MFLLSLTDPMAANMLESFTDDGPSDITSDDASSIGAEPVLVQEDDIFLQSLCNFIFDPVLLNMGNLEMSTTLEDTAARPAATIFQPEALGTLQVKSESAVQDLHALHEELAVNDESYSGLFAKVTVQQALSPESIIRFTTAYFHLTHHHIPIVYRQSFGSHDTATTLLLAVTLAGALRSPPQDDALSVRSLARLFEEYIFRYLEDIMATYGVSASPLESKWLLETLQAAILVNNVQFMVNNVVTRRRIRSRRLPVLVSVVRRLGPFAIRHSPDADGVQYLHEESCIR